MEAGYLVYNTGRVNSQRNVPIIGPQSVGKPEIHQNYFVKSGSKESK